MGQEHILTCFNLCAHVIEIWCIQEQAQQWDAPPPDDPNLQALHSTLLAHQGVIEALLARQSHSWQSYWQHQGGSDDTTNHHCSLPCWVHDPPDDPNTTHQFNNKTWYFVVNVMVVLGIPLIILKMILLTFVANIWIDLNHKLILVWSIFLNLLWTLL